MSIENKNIYVSYWILLITCLVALMIVIGGLTRLTDSGLSITRWDLFTGILPPLSIHKWEETFALYKEIPEYKLLNFSMTLEEFKTIFWWEYIHRLLGRIIGIFYILPLLFFTIKRKIEKKYLFSFYLIFILICFQGFMGWYMVQSGLTENTDVSHYRLSAHLIIAFIIFISLLWHFMKYSNYKSSLSQKKIPFNLEKVFFILVILQILTGAFVSGLDAGQIYQTWPLMNERYFPDDVLFADLFSIKIFETPSLLQFIHRNIAYFIFFIFLIIGWLIFFKNDFAYLRKITLFVFLSLLLQITLGILTLLSGVQIFLASMHQLGSIILITTSLILVYKNSKIN